METKKPFFAQLLESSTSLRVKTDVQAGGGPQVTTDKYPSDDDEDGWVFS